MAKKSYTAEPTKLQLCCERGLLALALVVGVYHMLMSIYKYYDAFTGTVLDHLGHILLGSFLAIGAAYCLFAKLKYPKTFGRITGFLRSLLCPETLLIFLFLLWYFISCFSADARYSGDFLTANRSIALDTSVSILVLFPLCLSLSPQKRKTVLHFIIHIIVGLMTVLMAIVLYYVFQPTTLTIPGGEIGMNKATRLCINCNPNTTGAYAAILFMLSIYMLLCQKPLVKVFYGFAVFVHMLVLMLSNSITSYLAVSAFLCITVFMFVFNLFSKKSMKARILFSLGAGVAAVLLFSALRLLTFAAFEAITHFSELIKANSGVRAIELDHANMRYRSMIWGYAIQGMTTDSQRAAFGVTPAGVISLIEMMSDGKIKMYTHNQFLEIGVAMGFPGLILYFIWLVRIAFNCIKVGLAPEDNAARGAFALPVIILGLVIANLTEATLLFYHFLPGAFFFLLCGMVTAEGKQLDLPAFLQLKPNKKKKRR